MSEKLAINGGTPVRKNPLPPSYPGLVCFSTSTSMSSASVPLLLR